MYLLNDFDVTIDDTMLGHAKTFEDSNGDKGEGGGFYVGPDAPGVDGYLTVSNCKTTPVADHIGVGTISHIEA
jgi:hypothetical protein